jgi:PDZ domain-containing secreted protein
MVAVREGDLLGRGAQAVILDVVPDIPAEEAGLDMGDYILAVEGSEFEFDKDLGDVIQAYQPSDTVTLEILREGEEQEVQVTLSENPESAGTAYLGVRYQMLPGMRFISRGELPGLHFEVVPRVEGRFRKVLPFVFGMPIGIHEEGMFYLNKGVRGILIASVEEGSPAEDAGLEKHDVITKLDGEEVEDMEAFSDAIRAHDPGDEVTVTIARPGEDEEMEIAVTLGAHPEKDGAGYVGVTLGGMIVTEVVDGDGEENDWHGPFHFHLDEFHHFDLPWCDDV